MASDSTAPDTDLVRCCNWSGSVPVVVTLAPTSLGTAMIPHPIHLMLNRGAYLHVGLRSAIQRLHNFAPATMILSSGMIIRNEPEPQSNDETEEPKKNDTATKVASTNHNTVSDLPVCWFEDEETQIPLRWHLFAGVLFDMMTTKPSSSGTIPWKIRLHFSNYPASELLPLETGHVGTAVERSFKNSLKQALFLQFGNSKVAMNMSKLTHQRLWDSIESTNYKLYQQINRDLQASPDNGGVQLLPIRLLVDSKPPIQRPCREKDTDGNATSLGSLLVGWLPELFQKSSNEEVTPKSKSCRSIVAGIAPPMTASILELWQNLCHPDHFLYIVVLTR